MIHIIIYRLYLSLDVASQFVAIGVAIRRNLRSMNFDRTFGVVPPVIIMKLQRLLIKLVRNIQRKCIKTSTYLGTVAWTLAL